MRICGHSGVSRSAERVSLANISFEEIGVVSSALADLPRVGLTIVSIQLRQNEIAALRHGASVGANASIFDTSSIAKRGGSSRGRRSNAHNSASASAAK